MPFKADEIEVECAVIGWQLDSVVCVVDFPDAALGAKLPVKCAEFACLFEAAAVEVEEVAPIAATAVAL